MSNRAWVTLATNDSYGLGALVLAHSLRRAGSAYPAVVLITPSVTEAMRDRLSAVFAEVVTVDVLDSGDAAHLALLQRPELGITFTKIHCWNLTQYEKCVFLDADTLVVQNCDELFEREELSAAPDVGWPDCFNSGVFVFKPSAETFSSLIVFAQERGSFDGGDQGLLNSYFSDWAHGDINKHLPFLYNVTSAAFYSYLPALKHYGQNLKIIHFIGAAKPWLQQFNWETRSVNAQEHLRELLQLWWDLFVSQVHSQLDPSMVKLEDVPTVIAPPQETFFYTEPRSEYNLYKPVLDPDSEFHWHHPDAQIPDTEVNVPMIDMTQFHDPWDFYRGHIPPITDETKSICSFLQVTEKQQEIKRHVWEPLPQHIQHYINTHHTETHHLDTHNTETPYTDNSRHIDLHHTDSHPSETYQEKNTQIIEPLSHHSLFNYHPEDHQKKQHDVVQPYVDYIDYNKQIETCSKFSYDQQNVQHSSSQEHNNYECYSSQNSNRFQSQFENQQDSLPFHKHYSTLSNYQSSHQHQCSPPQQDIHEDIDCSHVEHHNINSNHTNEMNFIQSNTTNVESESQVNQNHILTGHVQNNMEQFTQLLRNKVEYVYCVHLDHEKDRNRKKQKVKSIPITSTHENMNGFTSESEIEENEDFIIPRHPYDGFYLRHIMTIDSRGRKICTHEIPPTPSPSPSISPPESPIFFDAIAEISSPEDTILDIDKHDHSGVAGNLARVSTGAVGAQYEALDELTRRQGWEAGNIDYMGADSFANIWAKISQTLSQPPASEPKQPSAPPKDSTSSDVSDEVPLKASATKEITPRASTAIEDSKTISPDTSEKPKDSPLTKESAPATVDTSVKTSEVTLESTTLVETSDHATVPAEVSLSEIAASEKAAVPEETANIPGETPVTVESTAEIPVPVIEAALAEVATSTGAATPIETDKIPTPVVEASVAVEHSKEIVTETVPIVGTSEKNKGPLKEKTEEVAELSVTEVPKNVSEPVSTQPITSEAAPIVTTVAEATPSPAVAESLNPDEKSPKPADIPVASATDSPPLANTPSKEEVPTEPAAKSTEEAAQETRL